LNQSQIDAFVTSTVAVRMSVDEIECGIFER
jgi:hypothetical protein